LSIVVAAIYSFTQYNEYNNGRTTGLTDTMRYGYGTAMVIVVLFSSLLHYKEIKLSLNPYVILVTFLFGFLGMYFTYTRGALLGFLCGIPFAICFFNRKMGYILGSLTVGLIGVLIGFYLLGSGDYNSRFLLNKN